MSSFLTTNQLMILGIALALFFTSLSRAQTAPTDEWLAGNVALGALYTYSFDPPPANDVALNRLTDGVPRTPYAANLPAGQSVTLDLGKPLDRLHRVALHSWADAEHGVAASGFLLEASTDGVVFVEVGRLPKATALGWTLAEADLPPFSARYVRITALQYESAGQSTVDEIQVFRARPPVSGPRPERVAIFKDTSLKAGPGASSPDFLASLLKEAGLEPVLLGAAELASPASLNPASCPVLVLPYGEYFPVTAVENLRRYLMNGGSFFSTGGYAFNESYVPEGQKNELTATRWDLEQGQAGSEPDDWHIAGVSTLDTEIFHSGQQSLRIENPTEPMGGSQAALELPGFERGKQQSFRMKLWTKTEAIEGQGFAYIAVYQLDQQDNIVAWRDYVTLRG